MRSTRLSSPLCPRLRFWLACESVWPFPTRAWTSVPLPCRPRSRITMSHSAGTQRRCRKHHELGTSDEIIGQLEILLATMFQKRQRFDVIGAIGSSGCPPHRTSGSPAAHRAGNRGRSHRSGRLRSLSCRGNDLWRRDALGTSDRIGPSADLALRRRAKPCRRLRCVVEKFEIAQCEALSSPQGDAKGF